MHPHGLQPRVTSSIKHRLRCSSENSYCDDGIRRFMADNGQRTDRRGRLPAVAAVITSTDGVTKMPATGRAARKPGQRSCEPVRRQQELQAAESN